MERRRSLFLSFDFKLVFDFVLARNLTGLSSDGVLLLLAINRSLQGYFAVACDDFDVFSVYGQGTILDDGLPDLLSQREIVFAIGLLLRGICIFVLLRRIAFGVIGLSRVRSCRISGRNRRLLALRGTNEQDGGHGW